MQIGIPDDDPFEGDEPVLPGWEIPIANYFSHPGVVAQYDYDFGDGWEHKLTLEAIVQRQRGKKYPLCLDGARACPPEDCGGVGGYEEVLTVIQTPPTRSTRALFSGSVVGLIHRSSTREA